MVRPNLALSVAAPRAALSAVRDPISTWAPACAQRRASPEPRAPVPPTTAILKSAAANVLSLRSPDAQLGQLARRARRRHPRRAHEPQNSISALIIPRRGQPPDPPSFFFAPRRQSVALWRPAAERAPARPTAQHQQQLAAREGEQWTRL